MILSDERAVELANLIAEYVHDSVSEGDTFERAAEYTLASTVGDIVETTPLYLIDSLSSTAVKLSELS